MSRTVYSGISKAISQEVLLFLCRFLGILPLGEAIRSKKFNNLETVIVEKERRKRGDERCAAQVTSAGPASPAHSSDVRHVSE